MSDVFRRIFFWVLFRIPIIGPALSRTVMRQISKELSGARACVYVTCPYGQQHRWPAKRAALEPDAYAVSLRAWGAHHRACKEAGSG